MTAKPAPGATGTEVLWDEHGVPHIYAQIASECFYAFGWAQAKNHGNLLLRLYGQARGRAAEYWGRAYLKSDQWVAQMGICLRSHEWLEAQDPEFRLCLEAFAEGINDFARTHLESIADDLRPVLPVNALDVLSHSQRVVNFSFLVDPTAVAASERRQQPLGSNAWAIGPSKSATGHAMLLTNPHLPWADMFLCFEAHLNAPGIDAYGITLVGFPVLTMAFNQFLGWAHTVNAIPGWTLYELTLDGKGYRIDGELCAFDSVTSILRIKQPDGSLSEEEFTVRRSHHGPVLERGDRALALRVVGLDQPRALEQWWNMARATTLADFEHVLSQLQVPMFTVIYADREGHILHVFNGRVPVRPAEGANYPAQILPGEFSKYIWTDTYAYRDLPRVLDPASGWLQNANDPPWTTTVPPILSADQYPRTIAPRGPMTLRAQRATRILSVDRRFSLEDIVKLKYSMTMELADRVLDELLRACREHESPPVQSAFEVLSAWDRAADADSRGAVLFAAWVRTITPDRIFAIPWSESDPIATPRGLADPAGAVRALGAAAAAVEGIYGSLDVKWGEVFRLRSARADLPAVGADSVGVLSELWFLPTADHHFVAVGGDCYTAVVEFSTPVRAMVLTVYGNATQPNVVADDHQLELYARKQLRQALLNKEDVLAHLREREALSREVRPSVSEEPQGRL